MILQSQSSLRYSDWLILQSRYWGLAPEDSQGAGQAGWGPGRPHGEGDVGGGRPPDPEAGRLPGPGAHPPVPPCPCGRGCGPVRGGGGEGGPQADWLREIIVIYSCDVVIAGAGDGEWGMAACAAQGVHQGVKPVQGPGGGGTVAVILMKI